MKKFLLIVAGIVGIVIIGLLIFSNPKKPAEQFPSTAGRVQAPSLNLNDYNGRPVSLSNFSGKPLVINAWASWCPFCRKELPDFVTAQKEFGDQVVIIAINRAEPLEVAKKYSDELAVSRDLIFLLDPADSFYSSIGGFTMPETIFVDKDGYIREHKRGVMDLEEIRNKIKKII